MTALTRTLTHCNNLATNHDLVAVQDSASVMRQVLEQSTGESDITFVAKSEKLNELNITPQLSKLLQELLTHIEEGGDITFVPNTKLYSIREAKELLGMDESYLLELVKQGTISAKVLNDQKLIEASSLHRYKRQRKRKGFEILDQMFELEKEVYQNAKIARMLSD